MIRIKSKKDGFRRCGIAHSKEAVQYPDDRFSAGELAVLRAEPMLTVEIVKEKKESPPPDESPSKAVDADAPSEESAKAGKKGKR